MDDEFAEARRRNKAILDEIAERRRNMTEDERRQAAAEQDASRARIEAEKAERWERALREAPAQGKEPFDLEVFKAVYLNYGIVYEDHGFDLDAPDVEPRHAGAPWKQHPIRKPRTSWDQEVRKWEKHYYLGAWLTLEDFAEARERSDWWDHVVGAANPEEERDRARDRPGAKDQPPHRDPEDQIEHRRLTAMADAATQRGKERFDLNRFASLLSDYQPMVDSTREQETRRWCQRYYDDNPDVLTLVEFARIVDEDGD